jgi:pimeloyl-ACP methyl ester carboxylesterase
MEYTELMPNPASWRTTWPPMNPVAPIRRIRISRTSRPHYSNSDPMSLFCLVHGSTQNASCWDLLIPELERRGHETLRVNLPADEPDASATRYADIISEAIPERRGDTIVVAHSASGLFLPLVAQKRRIRRMAFLASVIPQIGKSLLDQLRDDPEMLNPEWIGKDPTKDEQIARYFLFHDCPPELSKWALSTLRLMYARQALAEICPLRHWPDVLSSYIFCRDDRTIRPEWSRRAARERLGVDPIKLPGGHCPHVSRPVQLADLLTTVA